MTTPTIDRSPTTMPLRILAGIVGAGIIACVTWAAVSAVGGINTPTGPLLVALAFGLVAGSMCAGFAWHNGRKAMAIALAATLLTGETYALLNTGERELEAREAKQAPVRAAMVTREKLSREAQAPVIVTTDRLAAAQKALDEVNTDARVKIATASCVKLCKQELAEQREAAQKEVEAARAELYAMRKASSDKVEAAQVALAAIPVAAAVSPLAARINVPDWVLDLIRATLFSVSTNGLGAFLLAFAAHRGGGVRIEAKAVEVEAPKMLSFESENGDRPKEEMDELKRLFGRLAEVLEKADGLNNQELASLAGLSPGHMSRLRQKLEAAGYVTSAKVGKEVRTRLVARDGVRVAA